MKCDELKSVYIDRTGGWVRSGPQVFHTKQFQKDFDLLVLRNGYRADSPKITFKNPKIRIGTGRPEWGAEYGKQYFIITWEA